MSDPRPWEVGDHQARWLGYLIAPDSSVLRNKVGATTAERLDVAENDLVEAPGRGFAWVNIEMTELHSACHAARTEGDTAPLRAIIAACLWTIPSTDR